MPPAELVGAEVEVGPPGFRVDDPVVDRRLPRVGGHLLCDRKVAILRIPEVGTFGVADGSHVSFDPAPGVSPHAEDVWLYGTVAALLLAQQGRFALHASVVDVGAQGVAVAGTLGAGKSTTALGLVQRGHRLVTDDVSPLDGVGPVTVRPFDRPLHVSRDTAEILGLDLSEAREPPPGYPKVALPVPSNGPARVRSIAVLRADGEGATVDAVRVRGARAHWLLLANAYRVALLREIWQAEMFAWAGAVASTVPVYEVTRPADGWTVDAVVQEVERLALEAPAFA